MTGLGPHCHLCGQSLSFFAYQVFTFVRFVARFRICTVGGGYDVLIVFNGGLIDVFPFVLLDGRRPIVNPICKARNATALLQASAAATAARVLRQIPLRPPESLLRPIPLRPQESTATAWLNHGACRARQHTVAHKSATEATPQRAATAANQWADEGPTPADCSVRAWPSAFDNTRPLRRDLSSGTSLMGEKTPPREEAGELPSSTDKGVQASASTGGSIGGRLLLLSSVATAAHRTSGRGPSLCRSRKGRA